MMARLLALILAALAGGWAGLIAAGSANPPELFESGFYWAHEPGEVRHITDAAMLHLPQRCTKDARVSFDTTLGINWCVCSITKCSLEIDSGTLFTTLGVWQPQAVANTREYLSYRFGMPIAMSGDTP